MLCFDLNDAIGLVEAAKLVRGRGGRRVCVDTLRRWASERRGCYPLGKAGPKVVLRTVRVNGELLTTRAWVEEFERERAGAGRLQGGGPSVQPPRERRAAQKRHEQAERDLDRMGA
jgi:hypothetical protein